MKTGFNISSSILMVLEILNYDVLENIIVNLELLKLEINMHYELRICELNYQRIVPTWTPRRPKLVPHEMIPISKIVWVKELRDKAFIFGTNLVWIWGFILPPKIRPTELGGNSSSNEIPNLILLHSMKMTYGRFNPSIIRRANFDEKILGFWKWCVQ